MGIYNFALFLNVTFYMEELRNYLRAGSARQVMLILDPRLAAGSYEFRFVLQSVRASVTLFSELVFPDITRKVRES